MPRVKGVIGCRFSGYEINDVYKQLIALCSISRTKSDYKIQIDVLTKRIEILESYRKTLEP